MSADKLSLCPNSYYSGSSTIASLQVWLKLLLSVLGILAGSLMIALGTFQINNLMSYCQIETGGGGTWFSGCNLPASYAGLIVSVILGAGIVFFSIRPKMLQALPFPSGIET